MKLKVCLVGNDYKQQFPLIGYGGIENTVEQLAFGLHKHFKDTVNFCAIVPKILQGDKSQYGFPVIETEYIESSVSGVMPNVFTQQVRHMLANADTKPDVIWSQSHWSAIGLHDLGIPIICTNQDSGPWEDGKFFPKHNVKYRMISQFIYDLVFKDANTNDYINQVKQNSFVQHTGMSDEGYELCVDKEDYILWVAGLNWGWQAKGLDIFISLAQMRGDKNFVVYGAGNPDMEQKLREAGKILKNFEYRGVLNRGREHTEAFKKAKLFAFLSQTNEAFGRTGLEAITKGTPVLGTMNGALPELYAPAGVCTNDINKMSATLDKQFDYHQVYEYSQKFHVRNEIENLIKVSREMMAS